ncbi:MAG: hypothetical protein OHK0012_10250 [Synechococcales cyanobacterium]
MWLVFALLSPLFWAMVHVLDAYCVDRVFEKPWMGVITSSLASSIVVVIVPFLVPYGLRPMTHWPLVGVALLAGALIQISQACYFQALAYSEAGIVAAYWNMTPTFLPLASYLLMGGVLDHTHYLGIGLLILTSVSFCLLDVHFFTRWRSFFLMVLASILQVAAILLEKYFFDREPFLLGFLFITLGIILAGSMPLLIPTVRHSFTANLPKLRSAALVLIGIEVINLVALFMSQQAVNLGIPSLVAAVETMIPAYAFLLSLFLAMVVPRFGDPETHHRLPAKLALVTIMALGVWMIS